MWISNRVDERLFDADASVDNFLDEQDGRIVTHLIEIVNVRRLSKHVAGDLGWENRPQGVPNLGVFFQFFKQSISLCKIKRTEYFL